MPQGLVVAQLVTRQRGRPPPISLKRPLTWVTSTRVAILTDPEGGTEEAGTVPLCADPAELERAVYLK